MIRVGEFSAEPFVLRQKFWLEKLKLPLQWVDFSGDLLANPEALLKTNEADGVLLPPFYSDLLLAASARIPTEVREAGYVDSVIRQNGAMWIRCYFREALHQLILEKASKLDTHAIAYVTGSDPLARLSAVVAIQMGFQKIVLISENHEEADQIIQQLQKLFFSLDFTLLRETELTLQPNNGSLLLNTLQAESGGVVFEDLTYLNFLKKDGLVVDLPILHHANPLLEEAKHVGILQLSGDEIWGLRDFFFLQALAVPLPMVSDYLKVWSQFLQEEKQT